MVYLFVSPLPVSVPLSSNCCFSFDIFEVMYNGTCRLTETNLGPGRFLFSSLSDDGYLEYLSECSFL